MFPSLSSLPKDLLRIGRSAMPTAKGTLSQAPPRRTEDSSEESESSSSEDDVPPGLEGRFAGGRGRKKAKAGGSMSGW